MLNILNRFWTWLTTKPDQTSHLVTSRDIKIGSTEPLPPRGGSAAAPPQNKPILSTEFGRTVYRVHNPPAPPSPPPPPSGPTLTDAVVAYAVYDAITSPPPPPPPPSYDPGPSSYDGGSSYSSGTGDFSGGSGSAGDF